MTPSQYAPLPSGPPPGPPGKTGCLPLLPPPLDPEKSSFCISPSPLPPLGPTQPRWGPPPPQFMVQNRPPLSGIRPSRPHMPPMPPPGPPQHGLGPPPPHSAVPNRPPLSGIRPLLPLMPPLPPGPPPSSNNIEVKRTTLDNNNWNNYI